MDEAACSVPVSCLSHAHVQFSNQHLTRGIEQNVEGCWSGVEGEEGFWLVDFEAGTLTKMDDGADDSFAFAARSRQSGEPVVRGVKFAVVTNNGEDPAGGHVDRGLSRKPAVQGQECSVMTHTGHGVASGHYDRGAVTRGIDVALMASNGSASGGFMDRGPE